MLIGYIDPNNGLTSQTNGSNMDQMALSDTKYGYLKLAIDQIDQHYGYLKFFMNQTWRGNRWKMWKIPIQALNCRCLFRIAKARKPLTSMVL